MKEISKGIFRRRSGFHGFKKNWTEIIKGYWREGEK